MPSQDAAACLCGNTRPVTVECESVCRGCGVVLGVERHPEGPGTGRLSLFLRLENGGRAAALPGRTKKLHIHGSDMGTVSDVCAKLSIRGAASVDVWRTYKRVLAMGVSKAAAACFAVYYVCRRDGVPFDEGMVRDSVCLAFHVCHAPTLLGVFFKVNKIANIAGKAWFAECAGMRMPTTTEANPPEFYLRRHLMRACARNPDASFDFLCSRATKLFGRLTDENAETRAKKAVRQAEIMAGLA